jgi:preprotein translocase subunit SecE
MADKKKTKKPGVLKRVAQWCSGLKAEFQKIIWPDKEKIYKDSVTVVTATICLGVVIALLDMILQYGMQLLVG